MKKLDDPEVFDVVMKFSAALSSRRVAKARWNAAREDLANAEHYLALCEKVVVETGDALNAALAS